MNVQACYLKKNSRAIDLQYIAWNMLVDILCTVYCDYFKAPGRLTWFPYPTSWINVNVFNVTLVEWCFIGCHQRYISYGLDDLQRIMTQFSGTHYVSWTKHMVLLCLFLVSLSPDVNSLDACVDILQCWFTDKFKTTLAEVTFKTTVVRCDLLITAYSAAYMRQWTESSLVHVMAWHLFGAKPLPEPRLAYCQSNWWEHISVEFES